MRVAMGNYEYHVSDEVGNLLLKTSIERDDLRAELKTSQEEVKKKQKMIDFLEAFNCHDCQDTGWLENRVDGRYPCTCFTECEGSPYHIEVERAEKAEAENQRLRWALEKIMKINGHISHDIAKQALGETNDLLDHLSSMGTINDVIDARLEADDE